MFRNLNQYRIRPHHCRYPTVHPATSTTVINSHQPRSRNPCLVFPFPPHRDQLHQSEFLPFRSRQQATSSRHTHRRRPSSLSHRSMLRLSTCASLASAHRQVVQPLKQVSRVYLYRVKLLHRREMESEDRHQTDHCHLRVSHQFA
jgi:hypothetical protein